LVRKKLTALLLTAPLLNSIGGCNGPLSPFGVLKCLK
jgi:hypothetical protein